MKKRITLLTLFLLAVMTMSAIPARPNLWRMITLADGSQVKARLVGDEHGHWYRDADGKSYVSAGNDVYKQEDATKVAARAKQRRARANQHYASRRKADISGNRGNYQGTKKGLIILPCELIFGNGHHLKECINQYIDLWHEDLDEAEGFRKWVANCCPICTTLVDRIVNGYPRNDEQQLWQRIGYKDAAMVQGEIFHLWVIEHDKNISIEELDKEWPARKAGLNVVLTDNEAPYHLRKTTLLNGPHTVLSPVAFLSGINIVRDACNDELVGKYIHQVMFNELLPTLELPKDELTRFAEDVLQRFKNPYIDHQVTSIMLNSFPKFKTRDLPALKRYTELKGELPKAIVLGLAAITTYYKGGTREDGTAITPNDDPAILELLQQLWASADCHAIAEGVLGAQELIWKEQGNLNDIPGLTDLLTSYLQQIQESGMRKAIESVLNK